MNPFTAIARSINQNCLCKTLDPQDQETKNLLIERPGIFSDTVMFISSHELGLMKELISTIEKVISLSPLQTEILSKAPHTAKTDFGPKGVFMGYDFHMTDDGPKLIEINTNAGGAYLNLLLAKAQISCCEEAMPLNNLDQVEENFFQSFMSEWKLQRDQQQLTSIAIMDENPETQFLYPEFRLFRDMFQKHGIETFIVDPKDLERKNDGLWFKTQKIDLIYNRSTDFYFDSEAYAGVREAYLKNEVVISPNPFHHALFANKENLELLTDAEKLQKYHVDSHDRETLLNGIPKTLLVTDENRNDLWSSRKKYFFKPTSGYGSKATYRGDKITTKVWEEMTRSDYVAQELAKPGLRMIESDGKPVELKQDIRVYTYNGKALLLASRLYSGQTTNFRTTGGGFAPVFVI